MLDVSMLVCRVKDGREMKHIRGPVSGEFMYWMNMGHYQKLSDRMIVIMSERQNREDAYAAVILLEISLNKRMSGNDAVKTAKIVAWWDMKDCPIPEGYDARRVHPSIERACKERGLSGSVSITAYADQTKTPDHHLQALSSTGVAVAHTISG
ncbi:hypothetical protein DY000_02054775 [Brassica cretica]|uniref:NYN domain-containing protein n=2 Tax=Brassica cretica TaxID=69181 RepID=A0ABQ7AJW6_BRACR|nr:hypothetical protein DY000_02054775 [Brassica cretica]